VDRPQGAPLLSIRGLVTRFYTYEGTVQALDGIDFYVRPGETFGLVGETGCGKSVTALSILRLVPVPPGKIEEGEVLFLVPQGTWAKILDAESAAIPALSSLRSALRGSSSAAEPDTKLLKALDKVFRTTPPRLDLKILNEVNGALKSTGREEAAKAQASRIVRGLIQLKTPYDLLGRSTEYLRKIRGNLIAMIFQEPMSALNPVIVAGDQIAENILLHQKEILARDVLADLDRRIPLLGRPRASADVDPATGLYRCTACGKEVPALVDSCPSCHARYFGPVIGGGASSLVLRAYRGLYRRMAKDPNDALLKIASRVPVLRRYERVMYRLALDRAVDMLRAVRIPDPEKVAASYPFELSGGMAQRVMIAIALSCSPKLLIADEPTTAVDVTIQAQVLKLMQDLRQRVGASVLLITHNLGVVAETCERVGVMYAGVMAEVGPTRSLFKEPLHPYTKGLMESIPRVTAEKDRLQIIRGNVPNLTKPPPGCRFHPRCPVALAHCGWSSDEVRSRLESFAKETGGGGSAVADQVQEWDDSDRTKLVLRTDGNATAVGEWVSKVLRERKGGDVALQAVESVAVDGDAVALTLLPQVKPPMLEPRPGHFVACYQYGGWPPA